jgi:membrane protease YdiL (CAAX protease family)
MGMQVVITFIYTFAVAFAVVFKMVLENNGLNDLEGMMDQLMSQIMSQLNVIIIISDIATLLLIFLILRKRWKEEKLWGFDKPKISPVPICFVLGITLNLSFDFIFSLLPKSVSEYPQPFDDVIGQNFILDFIAIVLLAALLEEIIFRGIVLKRLTKMINPMGLLCYRLLYSGLYI